MEQIDSRALEQNTGLLWRKDTAGQLKRETLTRWNRDTVEERDSVAVEQKYGEAVERDTAGQWKR